jgi:SAM-dependent methyltransferase
VRAERPHYDRFSMAAQDSQMTTDSTSPGGGDASRPWTALASDYEQARAREDSLDRLVEWPAQRDLLGDVNGLSVLDAGCGSDAKIADLVRDGAVASVGVDISDTFITGTPPGLELVQEDLSDLTAVEGLAGRSFDRILFCSRSATPTIRSMRSQRHGPCSTTTASCC